MPSAHYIRNTSLDVQEHVSIILSDKRVMLARKCWHISWCCKFISEAEYDLPSSRQSRQGQIRWSLSWSGFVVEHAEIDLSTPFTFQTLHLLKLEQQASACTSHFLSFSTSQSFSSLHCDANPILSQTPPARSCVPTHWIPYPTQPWIQPFF